MARNQLDEQIDLFVAHSRRLSCGSASNGVAHPSEAGGVSEVTSKLGAGVPTVSGRRDLDTGPCKHRLGGTVRGGLRYRVGAQRWE